MNGIRKIGLKIMDELECLKFISQTHRSLLVERSKHEWKIVLTSLTFYVLSVAGVYGGKITLPCIQESGFLVFVILRLIILVAFPGSAISIAMYLGYMHISNNKNKTFAENAENAIRDLLEGKTPRTFDVFCLKESRHWVSWGSFWGKNPDGTEKRGRWGWIGQVVIMFSFACAAALFILLKPGR